MAGEVTQPTSGGFGELLTSSTEVITTIGERDAALAAAEARGYRKAITALRKEAADFTYEEGQHHTFRYAADYLEAIAEEVK